MVNGGVGVLKMKTWSVTLHIEKHSANSLDVFQVKRYEQVSGTLCLSVLLIVTMCS